jgi:hypothetical protein
MKQRITQTRWPAGACAPGCFISSRVRVSAGQQIGDTKMSTTTKSNRKQELEEGIYTKHDMEVGQAYSWEACGIQSEAVCSICGLRHESGRGGQNTGHFDAWRDAHGNMLTLAEAAKVECG